ncbi:MAG: hypothetical protein V7K72_06485 [Nostoc sp.]|uniref:hypothetical protein n=1 Tax=Nostoc sp. TaxID=1180 RepID=UPI002FFB1A0E
MQHPWLNACKPMVVKIWSNMNPPLPKEQSSAVEGGCYLGRGEAIAYVRRTFTKILY